MFASDFIPFIMLYILLIPMGDL